MEKEKPKRRLPSILRWIIWVILFQLLLLNIAAAFYAYHLTHFYDDPSTYTPYESSNIFGKTWKLFTGPRLIKARIEESPAFPCDTIHLKTAKGLDINCWYARQDSSLGTVIMLHGLGGNKGMMMAEANEFRYLRYNVLMVDFRGHGASGGNTSTIGVKETEDLQLAVDFIRSKGENKIYCWGTSLGAVVIAKTIADKKIQPTAVILEMPFESLQSHLKGRARALGFPGTPEKPFSFFVTCWIGWERGFNGFDHRTTRYAKEISCPVLMQWGEQDHYVLRSETDAVFNAISGNNKKLIIYPRAGHESLLLNDTETWRREVEAFLRKTF